MLYNEAQYNEQPYQFFAINEVITLADDQTKSSTKILSESVFSSDFLTRQITNKILVENLDFIEWLSWKQQTPQWFD